MQNSFKSAAEFFRAANGKRVRKTVTGVLTVEQWPAVRDDIVRQLLEQGAKLEDIRIDDSQVAIGSQFWRAPAMRGEEFGILNVRSADYGFLPECGRTNGRPIFGDRKGCKVEGAALVKEYENGMRVCFEIMD